MIRWPVVVARLRDHQTLAEHRRLRTLCRGARDEVGHYPLDAKKVQMWLQEITCAVSRRTYWSLMQAVTGMPSTALRRFGALYWAVQFSASAVRPTISVADHICVLFAFCASSSSSARVRGRFRSPPDPLPFVPSTCV